MWVLQKLTYTLSKSELTPERKDIRVGEVNCCTKMMLGFLRGLTAHQVLTLVVFAISQLFQAVCVSLQAPFYPQVINGHDKTQASWTIIP